MQERRAIQGYIQAGIARCTGKIEKLSKTSWGLMTNGAQELTAVGMLSWFRRNKEKHYAVQFHSRSEVLVELLMLYSEGSASAVTTAVTKPYGERMKKLDNLIGLTIGEVSNILGQGVVGSLADALEKEIILSVPKVSEGPKVDLLAQAFEAYDGREDTLLLSQCDLFSESLMAECGIVVILNTNSIHKYLKTSNL